MIRGLAGVLTALTLGIGSAHAAIATSTSNAIHLSGDILQGDSAKVRAKVEETGIRVLVLSSNGGVAVEGYELGYTIKDLGLTAVVRRGEVCLSACAVAFIAGKEKVSEGLLGFHVAWANNALGTFSDGLKGGQYMGTLTAGYFFNMGYTLQIPYMVSRYTDSGTFLLLTTQDLKLFEMKDNDFTEPRDLPANWAATRIAGSTRLHLLRKGL